MFGKSLKNSLSGLSKLLTDSVLLLRLLVEDEDDEEDGVGTWVYLSTAEVEPGT